MPNNIQPLQKRFSGNRQHLLVAILGCFIIGRGVIGALLAWIGRAASEAGASQVVVTCVITERNVPLRIALTSAGFRADIGETGAVELPSWARRADPGRIAAYRITPSSLNLPDWVIQVP